MKRFLLILALWLATSMGALGQDIEKPAGDGSEGTPFQIATLENLYWVTKNPSSWSLHFKQTADIDASATKTNVWPNGWLPIGSENSPFAGSYDGQGHTISNLTVNRATEQFVGLFGATNGATIQKLGLLNVSIIGNITTGSLVGKNQGTITDCFSTGSVSGNNFTGGFVGTNTGTIKNCYTTTSVNCGNFSGGFVGNIEGSALVQYCYSSGTISVKDPLNNNFVGGFVGLVFGDVKNCNWNTQTSGKGNGVGTPYKPSTLKGLSSDDMKKPGSYAGWDMLTETTTTATYVWSLYSPLNNGLPYLEWQQEQPVIFTQDATRVYPTSAIANAKLFAFGTEAPKAYGICWNTKGNPTIADSKIDKGQAKDVGQFTVPLTNLTKDTKYYVRAYATNSAGISYGKEVSFTPSNIKLTIAAPTLKLSKIYDGTTAATIIALGKPVGIENGDDVKVTATASYDDANAKNGKTITVSYSLSGSSASSYLAPNSYTVSTGAITPRQLTAAADVTTTKGYDGSNVATITSTGEVSGIVGSDDVRVIANAQYDNADAGTGKTITVTYTLEGTNKSFYLAPAPLTLNGEIKPKEIKVIPTPNQSKKYGDTDLTIGYTTEPSISQSLLDGSLSLDELKNAGSHRIIMGTLLPKTGNYKFTLAEEYFKIEQKQLAWNFSSEITKAYDGTTKVTTLPSIDGIITGDDASVEITGSYNDKNVEPGKTASFSCTISGAKAGNYLLPAPANITTAAITQAPLIINPNNIDKRVEKVYSFAGTEFTTSGLFEGDELTSVTLTSNGAAASAAPGSYDIAASNAQGTGLSNYSITYNKGKFNVIDKITPTISWAEPAAITYGTKLNNKQLSATADAEGTFTYTPSAETLLNAGQGQALSVTFTPTDKVNYKAATKMVAINVAKAPLTATASDRTMVKGETIPVLGVTYDGFVNGDTEAVLDTKPTATTLATDASNAGNYDIVAANGTDGNYELAYVKGMLTISRITPTISWATPAAITYGTKLGDAQLSATADAPGTFTYVPAAGSLLSAGQGQAISVTFTPNDRVNYSEVKKTVAISVAKAPLTVTASNFTITKGEAIPTLGITYKGFVNGEDESVLDTKPTATTSATDASNAGTYDIVAANGTDGNYDFAYAKGTLSISRITPAITWEAPSAITYGTPLSSAQFSATASIEGAFTYAPAAGTVLNAGQGQTLSVTFTPTDRVNYNEATKTVAITVAKAPLTATASSYSIREGQAIPALGITYSGFVNGDTEAALDNRPTATTTATATSPTGVYGITVAGGADDCYKLAYAAGKFTVSNPIVVEALQATQPACEGDKLSLTYTLASGRPTEYQIVFDAKALAAGFDNSGYAALPADNGTVSFSIPARVADGTYQASLQLRDSYGNISEQAAFLLTVNVSADVIVPKFGSVVLIDNHEGRFTGYQWYRNGSAIGGATNQYYKDPNGLSGTYYAQLKTATGQTVNTCSKALSLKKSAQASVSVYPNPARAGQELTVKLAGFADEELQGAVLSVYSTQGAPVLTLRKVEQENRITLSGTDGVYMGRIATADGQVLTFKVVLAN